MEMTDAEIRRSTDIIGEVTREFSRATELNGTFNSAHEGYAVILEELDELWQEVKLKERLRSKEKMRIEAIQVAAMAVRFVHDLLPPKFQ